MSSNTSQMNKNKNVQKKKGLPQKVSVRQSNSIRYKANKPGRGVPFSHSPSEPFNYERSPLAKRFSIGTAVYNPTSSVPATASLIAVGAGDSSDTRLSNTIIMDNVHVMATVTLVTTGVAVVSDFTTRMLICSSVTNTTTAPLLSSTDPYSAINPAVVPETVMIWWDSGPLLLTPSTAGPTTIANINHRVYNFNHTVQLHKKGFRGSMAQFSSSAAANPLGNLYVVFYSDDGSGSATVTWKANFDVSFHDLSPAGVGAELAQIHRQIDVLPNAMAGQIKELIDCAIRDRFNPPSKLDT